MERVSKFQKLLNKAEIRAQVRGYVVQQEPDAEGITRLYFCRHLDSKDRLRVWDRKTINTMITDHLAKPGNNHDTLIQAMSKWFITEMNKGDPMRTAWAEACCDKFHKILDELKEQQQQQQPTLDLFSI